jgi:preprotein translocase subunit SecE
VKALFAKIKNWVTDVIAEMKKVSWAKRKELVGATALVLVIAVIMALYVGALDWLFSMLLKLLLPGQ